MRHFCVFGLIFLLASVSHADVKILYTGDFNGTLKACGCPGSPAGGIVNVATAVNLERGGGDVLLVDAGNFIPYLQAVRADYTGRLMGMMKYDAINVADRDLDEGVARLDSLARAHGLPLISASLLRSDTKQPAFPPYVIRKAGKARVGILGVTPPEVFALVPESRSKSLAFAGVDEALKRWLPEVRKRSDLVVLLGKLTEEEALRVRRTYPEVDIVVRGTGDMEWNTKYDGTDKTGVARATRYGTGLGVLTVKTAGKRKVAGLEDRKIAFAKADTADIAAQRLFEAYQAQITTSGAQAAPAPMASLPAPETCASCHEDQLTHWQGTRHAHAYEAVVKDGRTKDPECLTCHTTRYGQRGGFVSAEVTPKLAGVGCLSCHRISDGHPNGTTEAPAITAQVCLSCHDPKNSPAFKYETYLPKVKH